MYSISDIAKITMSNNSFLERMLTFNVIKENDNNLFDLDDIRAILIVKLIEHYKCNFTILDYSTIKCNIDMYEELIESHLMYNGINLNDFKSDIVNLDSRKYSFVESFSTFKENDQILVTFNPIDNNKIYLRHKLDGIYSITNNKYISCKYSGNMNDQLICIYKIISLCKEKNINIDPNYESTILKVKDSYDVNISFVIKYKNELKLSEVISNSKTVDININKLSSLLSLNDNNNIVHLFPGTSKVINSNSYSSVIGSSFKLSSVLIKDITIVDFINSNSHLTVMYHIVEKRKSCYVKVYYNALNSLLTVTVYKIDNNKKKSIFDRFKKDVVEVYSYTNLVDIISRIH